jgi:hypothetical protein
MKRQTYHTQWAAQFAIAAELSRRGYTVALTLGNARALDIICTAPSGLTFRVEVKGTASRTFVRTGNKILDMDLQESLFMVVVLVPYEETPFRFLFLLTRNCDKSDLPSHRQKPPAIPTS